MVMFLERPQVLESKKSYQAELTPLSIVMEGQDFLRHMFVG